MNNIPPDGPLAGVTVLDISQVMAGATCAAMLADLGADVIKIERTSGDELRAWGSAFPGGESPAYMAVNRNKRGMTLDLATEDGRRILHRLAADADILLENFRPGTMTKFGCDYEALSAINPRLIFCSISGFGQDGPYARRGGYDLVAQGMSGIMSVTGTPGGELVKAGIPVCDLTAGMHAATGILAAYIHALRTGEGQHVDTSLLDAGVATLVWESALYFSLGQVAQPAGSQMRLAAPYEAFATKDGHLTVGTPNQRLWLSLVSALGVDELGDDERFRKPTERLANRDVLHEILEEIFLGRTTDEWLDLLLPLGLPVGPINDVAGVFQDPQVLARDLKVSVEHPSVGTVQHLGVPIKLSRTPARIRRAAPVLGEHTRAVLGEAGFTDEEVAAFLRDGVVTDGQESR